MKCTKCTHDARHVIGGRLLCGCANGSCICPADDVCIYILWHHVPLPSLQLAFICTLL
ncbi:MAG: hypothetical protein ACLUEN_13195 [Coprococcus sp.]